MAEVRGARPRPRGLTIPIDTERDTRWTLVELLYCLQRDARRSWPAIRTRRSWKFLVWIVGTIITSSAGVVVDHRFHIIVQLLQVLVQEQRHG